MYHQLSLNSKQTLQKVAQTQKTAGIKDILQRMAAEPAFSSQGKNLFIYGTPIAGGLGGAYIAHDQGASPTLSAAVGVGTSMLSSPQRWKDIIHQAKASPDPFTAGGKTIMSDLLYKVAPATAVGIGEQVPNILSDVRRSTGNIANITSELNKVSPNVAKDIATTTGNIAGQSGPAAANLTGALGSIQPFWEQSAKTMQDVSKSTNKMTDTLDKVAPHLATSAGAMQDISKSIGGGIDALRGIPGNIRDSLDWSSFSPTQKLMAGGAGVGAGGLLLSKLLAHKDKNKPQRNK